MCDLLLQVDLGVIWEACVQMNWAATYSFMASVGQWWGCLAVTPMETLWLEGKLCDDWASDESRVRLWRGGCDPRSRCGGADSWVLVARTVADVWRQRVGV